MDRHTTWNKDCMSLYDRRARGALTMTTDSGGNNMKKADIISTINSLITEHKLDFDEVAEDTKTKVDELKDLLTDIEEAATEAAGPPTVTVAELCKDAGIDPKTVRNRLRRLYDDDEKAKDLPQPVDAGNRWTFAEDDREAVKALVLNEG